MPIERKYAVSVEELLINAIGQLNAELQGMNHKNVLLLVSGGSALSLLDRINPNVLNNNLTICVLDERYSTNSDENNMAQVVKKDFYAIALDKGCKFIDTRVQESETQNELAQRFNNALLEWFKSNPEGLVIATVGIGPDGHTSGMMPFPDDSQKFDELFCSTNENSLVVGYDAGDKNQYPLRVTTTMNLMRRINTAIVYAVGDNKRQPLEDTFANNGSLSSTPARILREMNGKVMLFTDQNVTI